MYSFPRDLYTDIRIETINKTNIKYENGKLKENKLREEKGAFIRIYDGERWYYSSTVDIDKIQEEINELARLAKPNKDIDLNPVVKRLEINKGEYLSYEKNNISKVDNAEKISLVKTYLPIVKEFKEVVNSEVIYKDMYMTKEIISSKGTNVKFDIQNACIVNRFNLLVDGKPEGSSLNIYETDFNKLFNQQDYFRDNIMKWIRFVKESVPVKPGIYTCILSPVVAGVFAHESFGHKSEADFMVGDEKMLEEWAIGSKVGADILNIIDTGDIEGSGYVPYDDEGTKTKETYLIKDGVLSGRLHSAYTSGSLKEDLTGNSRAISFEFEPIVRMTTTYIGAGKQTKEELFSGVKEGIYIEDLKHGSGMSTFTIAPSIAYMIRDGKIAEPVQISVITGNVMKTLYEIDGLSNKVEIRAFGTGGCGKMEQYPLSVGFGGPYVRVNGINVQ